MRRFLLAVAVLLAATTTPALAGYLVIRVILEGGSGAAPVGPAGPTAPCGPGGLSAAGGGPRGGSGGGGRPSPGPGGDGRPGGFTGGFPQMPAGPGSPPTDAHPSDPTRSVYVVVPFTKPPGKEWFYPTKQVRPDLLANPQWVAALTHPLGHTNLFADGQTIQFYTEFLLTPGDKKTKHSEIAAAFASWQRNPVDAQRLLDLVRDALENGMIKEALAYSDALLAASKDPKGQTKFTDRPKQFVTIYEKLAPKLKGSAARRPDAEFWQAQLAAPSTRVQGHYTLLTWDTPEAEQSRRLAQLEDNFRAFFLWHALRGVALEVPATSLLAVLPPTGDRVVMMARALEAISPYASLADRPAAARAVERLMMSADGFYAPDYDLLVLSPERLDGPGQTFRAQNRAMWREGSTRKDLMAGLGPKLGHDPQNPNAPIRTAESVARMQTLAMVEGYLEEEGELSAVSREGSRQLLYATGLLTRHVAAPNWLINGSADFFHRPKGPVFNTKDDGKTFVTVALTTGYGAPNYVLYKHFKDMLTRKELMTKGNPETLLRNVLTDAYYAAVRDGEEIDAPPPPPPSAPRPGSATALQPTPSPQPGFGGPSGPPPSGPRGGSGVSAAPGPYGSDVGGPVLGLPVEEDTSLIARRKRDRMVNKARASSWALFYHLAINDPAGLQRYCEELKKLPRDLPFDEKTAVDAFARAFNLSTSPTPESGKTTLKQFATAWLAAMDRVAAVGVDFELKPAEAPAGTNPNAPVFPGGLMPGPGGGDGRGGS
jgi:hypothetical protein